MDRLSGDSSTRIEDIIPLQRQGTVEDISAMTLFLVSKASTYITGQTIVVDGGQVLTSPNFTMNYESFRKGWTAKL